MKTINFQSALQVIYICGKICEAWFGLAVIKLIIKETLTDFQ